MYNSGIVRVIFKHGPPREVRADSFGDAASKVMCDNGDIVRFEWVIFSMEAPASTWQ